MAIKLELLPPVEAVNYLKGKGYAIGFDWRDVYAEEHARVFTVAKMMRLDLLELVHMEVTNAIAQGRSLKEFKDTLTPILQREGWWGRQELPDPDTGEIKNVQLGSPRRLEIIYDTNLRTAYSAGRWVRAERSKRRLPLLLYRTMQDTRVRPAHRAWDGVALPQDNGFWDTHYPPNGWRCRCIAYPISSDDLGRLQKAYDDSNGQRGVDVKRQAPPVETIEWTNPRSGEIRQIPVGIDPGFDYNPGTGALKRALAQRAEREAASSVLPKKTLEQIRQDGIDYVLAEGRKLQAQKIEFAYVYDAKGNVLIQKRGSESQVSFTDEEVKLMRAAEGVVIIHNHPSGSSLSEADYLLSNSVNAASVIAAGHNDVVYAGRIINRDRYVDRYPRIDSALYDIVGPLFRAGQIDNPTARRWHQHMLNTALERIGAITYTVEDVNGALQLPDDLAAAIDTLVERYN